MFVFGLPRTGTTLTINLLNADPARRCFLRWEALNSAPPAASGALAQRSALSCRASQAGDRDQVHAADRRDPLRGRGQPVRMPICHGADRSARRFSIPTSEFRAIANGFSTPTICRPSAFQQAIAADAAGEERRPLDAEESLASAVSRRPHHRLSRRATGHDAPRSGGGGGLGVQPDPACAADL